MLVYIRIFHFIIIITIITITLLYCFCFDIYFKLFLEAPFGWVR